MRRVYLASVFILLSVPLASAQTLRIYHIDVEQADSALLVMPNGKSLLIDSGNNRQGDRLRKVMAQAGVTQIDALVISHYHADHYGSADDLINDGISILETYDRGRRDLVKPEDKTKPRYKEYMEAVGEDAIALRPGDTISLDPTVTIKCLAPSGAVMGAPTMTSDDENDLSVSLLIEFAGFKAFFGGDTHELVEAMIAANDLAKDVDLYKASHHGSDTSSSAAFLSDLNPTLIVISNGSNGIYKHPRAVTLQAYQSLTPAPTVIQTNRCKISAPCGNVPPAFIADPEQSGKDGTIQISADAVTRTFTVRYGLTTVRTFAFKAAGSPGVTPSANAVIQSLLPNPAGDDEQLEEVTIRNAGTAVLSLSGWTLKDRSGLTWALTGTMSAGQTLTVRRNGQAMTLNNTGDEISLVDDANVERDRFSYASSSQGQRIQTNH
jgi:beta-lactamase superfamily II metal-dependent hydrolase